MGTLMNIPDFGLIRYWQLDHTHWESAFSVSCMFEGAFTPYIGTLVNIPDLGLIRYWQLDHTH